MGKYGYDGSLNTPSYDTPVSERLSLSDLLRFNNRLYFTIKYAYVVLKTRRQAIKGIFDDEAWVDSSHYIFR